MKTYSFIGSDKNAGKTTAFTFVYRKILNSGSAGNKVCLTSSGITGKATDHFGSDKKPEINLYKHSYFVTTGEHLKGKTGMYEVLFNFSSPDYSKLFTFGRCLCNFSIILEGPNTGEEMRKMKSAINLLLPETYLLIDGSIDRQFLAHPDISDAFYFAIRFTHKNEQLQKAGDLLFPLTIPHYSEEKRAKTDKYLTDHIKSILFDRDLNPLFMGREPPFLDQSLKTMCKKYQHTECVLYLNGALSKSLADFFSGFDNLTVVLDNFTLYHDISKTPAKKTFMPSLYLYHPVTVNKIFIRFEDNINRVPDHLPFPENIPVHNLFRENFHEISI